MTDRFLVFNANRAGDIRAKEDEVGGRRRRKERRRGKKSNDDSNDVEDDRSFLCRSRKVQVTLFKAWEEVIAVTVVSQT